MTEAAPALRFISFRRWGAARALWVDFTCHMTGLARRSKPGRLASPE